MMAPRLRARFRPASSDALSATRALVAAMYAPVLADEDAVQRLCLATHELLENAMKYSRDGVAELDIALGSDGAGAGVVHLRVSNATDPARGARLRLHVDEVRLAPDADAHYRRLIAASVARTDGGSGLGLGRVRAEAEARLACEIASATATVYADLPVGLRAGARG